jgi:predicted amino acid dehydrogenase
LADLKNAQLVLTVTNAIEAVISLQDIRSGTVICDVARPRDVAITGTPVRDDILVIDGGVVDVPGQVDFHFNFGLPPGKAYACMAETFALALEGRFEDYTLGQEIGLARVEDIRNIANKHGFRLGGFRSFDRSVTQDQIEHIRKIVRKHSA